ncbi:protein YIF1B-like isoform X5 [Portunus trituberculatus]|uniref:protein YIF1B-like isoform X5 n=1 Tax=Portunus trituberculatus TaxID=210409 RepID=UPI001E1CFFB5|nr:protein YIF1B-like isoform X5 [Portunus trituberculatus]
MDYSMSGVRKSRFGQQVRGRKSTGGESRGSGDGATMYDPQYQQQYDAYGQPLPQQGGPQPQLFEDTSGQAYNNYGNQGYGGGMDYGYPNTREGGQQGQQAYGAYPGNMPGPQIFQDPMVANMAMQYGQSLASQGREYMDKKIEKYVSTSQIKYYFAVDTHYVMKKLQLLLFPYTHTDWSVRYEQDNPVQPRHEVNAPDLYIPLMAVVTYILVAGLCLGLQKRMIVSLLAGLVMDSLGYYGVLAYCSLSLVVFMFRTLRWQVQGSGGTMEAYSVGNKRRLYLLLFMSGLQPLMMWWLTHHLVA